MNHALRPNVSGARRNLIPVQVGAAVVLMLGLGPASANSDAKQLPLYDAFKEFCLDTRVDPALIERAIKISPFEIRRRTYASSDFPNSMRLNVTIWDMTYEGHKMILNVGHSTTAFGPDMIQDSDNCNVVSYSSEDGSIAALFKWAGISPPRTDTPATRRKDLGPTVSALEFTWDSAKPEPFTDSGPHSPGAGLRASGRAWRLTIVPALYANTAMLIRYGVARPKP